MNSVNQGLVDAVRELMNLNAMKAVNLSIFDEDKEAVEKVYAALRAAESQAAPAFSEDELVEYVGLAIYEKIAGYSTPSHARYYAKEAIQALQKAGAISVREGE